MIIVDWNLVSGRAQLGNPGLVCRYGSFVLYGGTLAVHIRYDFDRYEKFYWKDVNVVRTLPWSSLCFWFTIISLAFSSSVNYWYFYIILFYIILWIYLIYVAISYFWSTQGNSRCCHICLQRTPKNHFHYRHFLWWNLKWFYVLPFCTFLCCCCCFFFVSRQRENLCIDSRRSNLSHKSQF